MESEKYSYQKEWEEYKKRQKTFWLVCLGYIPLVLVILPLEYISKTDTAIGFVLSLLFVIFLLVFAFYSIKLQFWKCPQCEKSFHNTWWRSNIFSRKCLHCKLPKYQGSTFGN